MNTSIFVDKTLKLSGKINTKNLVTYFNLSINDGIDRTTTVKRLITVKNLQTKITGVNTIKIKRYQKFNILENFKVVECREKYYK